MPDDIVSREKIMMQVYFFPAMEYTVNISRIIDFSRKERMFFMNLAKVSANGQITVPVEIRRLLGLRSGDKVLFFQKPDGDIVMTNASSQAIRKAQAAFADAAETMGLTDEEDIQALVDEARYGAER